MPREFADSSIYTVQPGDTLSGIAAGNDCSLDLILAANSGLIGDASMIQVGWEIVIPGALTGSRRSAPPAGDGISSYTIEAGDTLGALAARWGTTVAAIAALNGIVNPALIFVGQRIRKPGAAEEAATETASVAATTQSVEAIPIVPGRLTFVRWPLDMPPGVVTGGYRQDYGNYLHRGIDIGHVPVGTPIFAPAGGNLTVHRPGDGWGDGSFGNNVVIDHPGTPWWSIYAHMNATSRSTGEVVAAGDVIGEVGFTGMVDPPGPGGAHLHWQVSAHPGFPQGWEYIANPLDFLVTG
ncbi:MAG: LysM peptidoglycan-binding domain-containing M23 family metallopeptidase [Dehalococcoidia bacterium]